MALIDLVSDLSNFKGQSQYDDLDSQIKNGVDFIPNTDASGFTPKTDLESLYNKVKNGTVVAPNSGVVTNEKTRNPYGAQDEYFVANGIGIANPSHILSGDNILGVRLQPQFVTDFMTTPIADYNSRFSLSTPLGAGSKTLGVLRVIHTADNSLATQNANYNSVKNEGPFSGVSDFSVQTTKRLYNDSSYIKDLFEFKDNNFTNVPSGLTDADVFSTDNFRSVANRNVKNASGIHPIILRKPGSNWDDYLNEKGIISEGGFFEGTLGLLGLLTRTSRDLADKQRIGTYLLSDPGLLFIAKQFAFQALNPTLESKIYNPLSAVGIAGASDLLQGDISGLLRAAGSFLFPTHVERHLGGLRYEKIILGPGGSRLINQSKAFGLDIPEINVPSSNTGVGMFDNYVNRQVNNLVSTIDAASITPIFGLSNPNKYAFPISSAPKSVVDGRPSFIGGADLALEDVRSALEKPGGTFNDASSIDNSSQTQNVFHTSTYSELIIENGYETNLKMPKGQQGTEIRGGDKRDEADVNKDVGNPGLSDDNFTLGATRNSLSGFVKQLPSNNSIKSDAVDRVNIIPYGSDSEGNIPNEHKLTKDFIKFRFFDVVNRKFIIFRAILEGITDTITPEYGEERYIGRPDKLFTYQGVDRSLSFTFSIYPKTKQELPVLMEKLNYLIGLCYPSFTAGDRMVTPFIDLTLGDMFVSTPGILSSLTVTVEEQSTWEISDGLQFPHFIKAACEFRHIGKHVPVSTGKHYDLPFGLNDEKQKQVDRFTNDKVFAFNQYPSREEPFRTEVFGPLGQPNE